jgi:hypothetical protein
MFEPRKVVRCWSEAVAVGGLSFVNTVKSELGFKAAHPAALRRFNSSRVQEFKVILDARTGDQRYICALGRK